MEDRYAILSKAGVFDIYSANQKYKITSDRKFLFATKNDDFVEVITGNLSSDVNDIFEMILDSQRKEFFYIKAIKNLLKQREYLTLLNSHALKHITDEEFSNELSTNEDKYLIEVDEELTITAFRTILKIAEKLQIKLHDDELSEIFSVDVLSTPVLLTEFMNHGKICP